MEEFNYCLVAGRTDVGRKRAANEDNMGNAVTINGYVSVVCDGMGGHVGGATASKVAVNAILENLRTNYYEDPRIAIGESIDIANRAVLSEAAAHPELTGMGSTCVLLIVRGGKVYIGHVGDSRIYLIRSKRIIQLTKDHSYVQMLVDRGEITKEQAEHHPRKNQITNALGLPNMTPATVADDAFIPEAGDCFILCSDGLSGMVSDEVINKVVSRQSELGAQERVDRLVAIANENGGIDNITVQMVEFTITPGNAVPKRKLPLWLKIVVPAIVLLAIGCGVYFLISPRKEAPQEEAAGSDVPQYVRDTNRINLGSVAFAAHEELATLTFSDNCLTIEGKLNYRENVDFDMNTISFEPKDCLDNLVKGEFIRVLKFQSATPGDKVDIFIMTRDSTLIYDFYFTFTGKGEVSGNLNGIRIPSAKGKTDSVSTTVVRMDLGGFGLEKGKKIIFNYSAKPFIRIEGKDHSVENPSKGDIRIDSVQDDKIVFDKSFWKMESKRNHRLLSFEYNGESNASAPQTFRIPCRLKGSGEELLLEVTLTPLVKEGSPEGNLHEEKVKPVQTDSIPQP